MKMLPPQNIDAEKSTLGAILTDQSVMLDVVEVLNPEDFYRADHSLIYKAMVRLFTQSKPIDIITVTEELSSSGEIEKAGGASYIISLTEEVPITSNAVQYASIVADKAVQRRLIKAGGDIAKASYEPDGDINGLIEMAEKAVFDVSQGRATKAYVKISDVLPRVFEEVTEISQGKDISGIPTGFTDLDKILYGLHSPDLVMVAARPGMGKTAFMLNLAQYAAVKKNIPVAVFNLEMSNEQLVKRLISSEAGIESEKLRNGQLSPDDWNNFASIFNTLGNAPIYFDDNTDMTVNAIRAKCRKLKLEKGIQLVVVDYLQLMKSGSYADSRQNEVSDISRALKVMARELEVPVVVGSQLSREVEKRADKRPMLSDLRESGSIEQDADVVMFLYRDDYYNKESQFQNVAEVIIGKHRNGSTGTVKLAFDPAKMSFRNLSFVGSKQQLPNS
ncbi:MAG: replicative DNA helicase [Clostridia bacterium]|nr:replicative DNA helicase [Clostridia bacterium]